RSKQLSRPHSRLRSIGVDAASWMAALPDHVHLDTLYLPGTHQSLALNYPLASSLCQTTSLTAQLRGGIRCLDLRFSLIRDDKKGGKLRLWAYHGPVPQGREMGEVFQELYDWLGSEDGKQETVIVSVKQENTGHHEFAALVWELIDSTRPYMWYDQNMWPTLGQVRGRCVMFCRFGFDSGRESALCGLHPPVWPNDKPYPWRTEIGGRATVVQDWVSLHARVVIIHAQVVKQLPLFAAALLAKADNEPPTVPFRINFLSCGTFPTLYPSHAAKGFGTPRFGIGYRGVN
ncbi:PLC-like phosphodiesterase, partial [Rhodotorula sp. JG-1b]